MVCGRYNKVSILTSRLGSAQLPAGSSAGYLKPNNQQDRNTDSPSADRLRKVILSSEIPP